MAKNNEATVHLKMPSDLRNHVLGTLRLRGTTMQSFFVDIAKLIVRDEELLKMLESKRDVLREGREVVHS